MSYDFQKKLANRQIYERNKITNYIKNERKKERKKRKKEGKLLTRKKNKQTNLQKSNLLLSFFVNFNLFYYGSSKLFYVIKINK